MEIVTCNVKDCINTIDEAEIPMEIVVSGIEEELQVCEGHAEEIVSKYFSHLIEEEAPADTADTASQNGGEANV